MTQLSNTVIGMAADGLTTQGFKESANMILISFSWNNLASRPEGFRYHILGSF